MINFWEIFQPRKILSQEFLALKQVITKQTEILDIEVHKMSNVVSKVNDHVALLKTIMPHISKIEKISDTRKDAKNSIYKDITKLNEREK